MTCIGSWTQVFANRSLDWSNQSLTYFQFPRLHLVCAHITSQHTHSHHNTHTLSGFKTLSNQFGAHVGLTRSWKTQLTHWILISYRKRAREQIKQQFNDKFTRLKIRFHWSWLFCRTLHKQNWHKHTNVCLQPLNKPMFEPIDPEGSHKLSTITQHIHTHTSQFG